MFIIFSDVSENSNFMNDSNNPKIDQSYLFVANNNSWINNNKYSETEKNNLFTSSNLPTSNNLNQNVVISNQNVPYLNIVKFYRYIYVCNIEYISINIVNRMIIKFLHP